MFEFLQESTLITLDFIWKVLLSDRNFATLLKIRLWKTLTPKLYQGQDQDSKIAILWETNCPYKGMPLLNLHSITVIIAIWGTPLDLRLPVIQSQMFHTRKTTKKLCKGTPPSLFSSLYKIITKMIQLAC